MITPNFSENRIGVLASRLSHSPNQVDVFGNDREDYQSILTLKLLESPEQPTEETHKRKWVNTVLKNRVIDYQRQRRKVEVLRQDVSIDNFEPTYDNWEEKIIQRDLLKKLRDALAESEWSLLIAFVEHGTVRDAWQATEPHITERAFGRRLRAILDRSKRILQKI